MSSDACPTEEDLAGYVAGQSSDHEAAEIGTHIQNCPRCVKWLTDSQGDEALLVDVLDALGPPSRQSAPKPGAHGAEADAAETARDPFAGRQQGIEGYDIIREKDHGGQGIVYEAIQQSTKRKVAIKVLWGGSSASPEARKRFEREVELAARLQHPNIVAVFDSGTTSVGRQFCVMDYVSGVPLDRYVQDEELTLEQTLRLFGTICGAVNHAHQRGVIHRDLKPTNILVDAEGRAKILDFGLAKQLTATGETVLTVTAGAVGTLPFMSPEQIRGVPDGVDTRSDVYALGVILYLLLTGHFPYPVVGQLHEVARHIAETPPTPPNREWTSGAGVTKSSTRRIRSGACPIDDEISTILLKVLAKDPGRRYQSVGEFASDLERYLTGATIEAKRDSHWYVFRKTLRRYRLAAMVSAGFVVLTVGFAVVMTLQAARIAKEREAANRQAQIAGAVNRFLQDILAAPDPFALAFVQSGARDMKVVEALDKASSRIETALIDRPEVEAAVRLTVGKTYMHLGYVEKADQHLVRAGELYSRLFGPEHADTLEVMAIRGEHAWWHGDLDRAEELYGEVLEYRRRLLGDEHQDTVTTMRDLAIVLSRHGKLDRAEALLSEALDIQRRTLGDDHVETVMTLSYLASQRLVQGRLVEAGHLHRQVVAGYQRHLGHQHPLTAAMKHNLARTLAEQGEYEKAEPLFREALEGIRSAVGDEHPQSMTLELGLATALGKRGQTADAERRLLRVAERLRQLFGDDYPILSATQVVLATLYLDQGRYVEAEQVSYQALERARRVVGETHRFTWKAMAQLAVALDRQGKYADAESYYTQFEDICKRVAPIDHYYVAETRAEYGRCLIELGRYDEAESRLLESHSVLARAVGSADPRTMKVMEYLAELYESWERLEQATAWQARIAAATATVASTSDNDRPNP